MNKPPLYAFQQDGIDWLIATTKRTGTAFLADFMGLGKSVQAVHAADELEIEHITVICPAIAVEDWARKFKEWSWFERKVLIATHRTPIHPKTIAKRSVLICSYETALSHRKLFRANPHSGLLIIDEAHYCKSPTARRTRAIYGGHCRGEHSIVQPYDYVWLLSGTPNPRGDPRELWPHLRALRPFSIVDEDGEPLTYTAFGQRFCRFEHNGFGLKMVGTRNMPELHRVLSPFVLRRLPEACPDMPEISFETVRMRASKVPTGVAFGDFPELRERLEAIIRGAEANDLSAQLQEQLGTLRRLTGLLKIEATVKLCAEELRNETVSKMVIFAFHVDVCRQIWTRLNHGAVSAGLIVGETSMSDRWKAIDSFQNGPTRAIVAQINAASVNTTLTAAHHVTFAETDWNPSNNLQGAYRCRRIGQAHPVLVRIVSIIGSLDELLQEAALRKMRTTQEIFGRLETCQKSA